ncbi:MAG: T9SS type A sorting domain-containing protein [Bacteroidales bacterium]|nr:T9SS type A sorting domain-containing protein [Bacteroidales bacterium]
MKKILLLFVIVLFFANIMRSQTPIAHWPLDDNANDIIDGKNGTVVGGVQFLNDPDRGDVAYFDGVDGVIELPSLIYGDTTEIKSIANTTISCWFNWDGGAAWQRVYSLGAPIGLWRMLYFCPHDGWDPAGFHVTVHNGLTDTWSDFCHAWGSFTDFDLVTAGEWYHGVVVLGDVGMKIYMNGAKIVDADTIDISPAAIQEADSSYNVLGASHWADPTYSGMIDDFRIYDEALTDAKVLELYNEGGTGINEDNIIHSNRFYSFDGRIRYTNINGINISKVTVYSITGNLLFSTEHISELDTQQFRSGIYLISVQSDREQFTSKVMIVN